MNILGVHEDDTHISGEKRTVYFPNEVRQFPMPEYGWAIIALILQPEFVHGNLLKLLPSPAVDLAFTLGECFSYRFGNRLLHRKSNS